MDTFTLFLILFPVIFGGMMLMKWRTDRIYGTPEQRAADLYGWEPPEQTQHPAPPAPRQLQPSPAVDHAAMLTTPQPIYAAPVPITPAAPAVRILPMDLTFKALVDSLHLLVVGETEAGKSTAAEAVLVGRVKAGDYVLILDPHADPSMWCGVPAIGMGRDYAAIGTAMAALLHELTTRYQRKALGDTTYQPITIFIDEWPAIQSHCKNAGAFMTELAQEGRKVGMRLVIMTQSDRVESLGISGKGDVRSNFTFLLLGAKAVESLPAIADRPRPAVLRRAGVTVGATVDGLNIYQRAVVDPQAVYHLSTIPVPPAAPEPADEVIDFDAEMRYWLGDTAINDEANISKIRAANQPPYQPVPAAVPDRQGSEPAAVPLAVPLAVPVETAGNPSNIERAAIRQLLTDGLSANAIAAELGGTRATRLAQIRAVKEAMQPATSEALTDEQTAPEVTAGLLVTDKAAA